MDNSRTNYFFNRGFAKGELGLFKNALVDYEEAILLAPENPNVYRLRGLTYFRNSNISEACDNWKKAKSFGSEAVDELLSRCE